MPKYIILNKAVGETPLSCAEAWRATQPDLVGVPLSYAGRLDPMASGKLLVLIGDECKHQADYHGLDKEYEFSVLFGIASDTHDVLGRLHTTTESKSQNHPHIIQEALEAIAASLIGELTVPYPLFSAKTVLGKPLHMWTLEGRLDEIEIPTRTSTIFELTLTKLETLSRSDVVKHALAKIETIPPVNDPRKALGNDFRRVDVRKDWNEILQDGRLPDSYMIASFRCIASSGTYMRTLATIIAKECSTVGLAWSIHRTKIGIYDSETLTWSHQY
jgi:tRNA pseudouridine(55) synthase